MSSHLAILDAMPSATDFYGNYWNRRPFVVRGAVGEDVMAGLISADELAGLSMEDAPQSRMVTTGGNHQDWSCHFGPFTEEDFKASGDTGWTLLVQNVEQFHPDTAALLRYFDFAPRWLIDDIMVSFSVKGGSVGPHMDSYHVFLVQGQGERRWKVGRQVITDDIYLEGLDLKILKDNLDGDEIDLNCGDVLYVPPRFGHEGTTLDDALTFSVGFLGPKLSDLFGSYGAYLSERKDLDQRYVGDLLDTDSAGAEISHCAVDNLRESLGRHLNTDAFTRWLVEFFTESGHEGFGNYTERDVVLTGEEFRARLNNGGGLIKPAYVKFAVTASPSGQFCLGFDCHSFFLDKGLLLLVRDFMGENVVTATDRPETLDDPATFEFLLELYNHQALEFLVL